MLYILVFRRGNAHSYILLVWLDLLHPNI